MYVLLGANGNVTSKVVALLLAQGAKVRVIGRNANTLAALKAQGAAIAVGSITDTNFLARAFAGASAVYTMIPTDYAAPDLAAAQDESGENIASAIAAAKVKRVINLSSIGAHLSSGTGPIVGLYRQEQRLNALTSVDVLHVRPGYFYENHLLAIDTILSVGAYADMTAPDAPLPMVATADIAEVIARELIASSNALVDVSGARKRVLHLRAPNLYTMRDATALLGAAIDQPTLPYIQADPSQGKEALLQHGFSASAAASMEEMSDAFSTGRLDGEYEKGPTEITATTLERFAETVFKPLFGMSADARKTA